MDQVGGVTAREALPSLRANLLFYLDDLREPGACSLSVGKEPAFESRGFLGKLTGRDRRKSPLHPRVQSQCKPAAARDIPEASIHQHPPFFGMSAKSEISPWFLAGRPRARLWPRQRASHHPFRRQAPIFCSNFSGGIRLLTRVLLLPSTNASALPRLCDRP